ncbi:MAG: ectoine utilization protein EutA [Devosia sp.]
MSVVDAARVDLAAQVRVRLDDRAVAKRVALVALSTDHTVERDFARYCDPAHIGVYVNRITFQNPTTRESLLATGPRITAAAAAILPEDPVDVAVYACTAASAVLGHDTVAHHLTKAKPGAVCVTPGAAAAQGFQALGVRRISILSPYTDDVAQEMGQYFRSLGTEVASIAHLGLADDRDMARISEHTIMEAGLAACNPSADALFISCTALRAVPCVEALETALNRPVVTSNQALAWEVLRHVGERPRWGATQRLFGAN